jgi:hypothetical protein
MSKRWMQFGMQKIIVGAVMFVLLSLVIAPAALIAQGESEADGDDGLPSCAVNESQLLGQPNRLNGSSAGIYTPALMTQHGQMGLVVDVSSFPSDMALAMPSPTNITPDGEPSVAILIVDDMTTPLGAGYEGHGAYVLRVITDLYHTLDKDVQSEILIQDINVPGYDVPDMVARLRGEISALQATYPALTQFVINMSFNLIPCTAEVVAPNGNSFIFNFADFFEAYLVSVNELEGRSLSLLEYFAGQLGYDYESEDDRFLVADLIVQLMVNQADDFLDPLYEFIATAPGDYGVNIVPVNSAGNFGETEFVRNMQQPFAPGIWENVISVSALKGPSGSGTNLFDFSNPGEIGATGGWYPLGVNRYRDPIYGAGTSFAAPAASLFTAVQLIDNNGCTYNPSLTDAPFDNVWYMDAITANC